MEFGFKYRYINGINVEPWLFRKINDTLITLITYLLHVLTNTQGKLRRTAGTLNSGLRDARWRQITKSSTICNVLKRILWTYGTSINGWACIGSTCEFEQSRRSVVARSVDNGPASPRSVWMTGDGHCAWRYNTVCRVPRHPSMPPSRRSGDGRVAKLTRSLKFFEVTRQ